MDVEKRKRRSRPQTGHAPRFPYREPVASHWGVCFTACREGNGVSSSEFPPNGSNRLVPWGGDRLADYTGFSIILTWLAVATALLTVGGVLKRSPLLLLPAASVATPLVIGATAFAAPVTVVGLLLLPGGLAMGPWGLMKKRPLRVRMPAVAGTVAFGMIGIRVLGLATGGSGLTVGRVGAITDKFPSAPAGAGDPEGRGCVFSIWNRGNHVADGVVVGGSMGK